MRRSHLGWVAGALAVSTACGPGEGTEVIIVSDTDEIDETPPVVEHSPITEPQTWGVDVLIEARAVDNETEDGSVFTMELVYQQETAIEWRSKSMIEVGGNKEDWYLFQGTINGADVGSGGMRYFIRAYDDWENQGCAPEDCEEDAWRFPVVPP
jgi:hypothetical protein